MRARRALLLAAGALAAGAALAQETPKGLPPGTGTLRGRIVRDAPGEVGGLAVVLYAIPPDGDPGLGRAVSDASGGFAFEGIASAPDVSYLVGVRADDLPYGTRAAFAAGETVHEVELRIASPSEDASAALPISARLRIDQGCGGLRMVETHELRNPDERVIFVPEARRAGRTPLLELTLPEGASPISVPFGSQGLEQDGGRVVFWGPLHPGVHEIEFAYSLPAARAAELAWSLPRGVGRVEVLTGERGPTLAGDGLRRGSPRELDGHRYSVHEAGPLAPGAPLRLHLEIPPPVAAPVEIAEAQTWLELDDAALVVDASYHLEVAGSEPLTATSDAPLLCIPLPPEASGLRFSPATLAMGAEPDPSGELALRGPIPAGASTAVLRYRIPVKEDRVELAQRFAHGVPIWSVFVADTGVAVETTRLHRRRPIRNDDRSYLHLEAFQLAPDERVALELRRLPPRRPPPRLAQAGFSLALAAAGIAFLVAPLHRRREEASQDPAEAQLETERDSISAALQSLEEDFETGKLAASDYEELRAELRARLAELIQRREAARSAARSETAGAAPAAARCSSCSAELTADARFCHRCGTPVATAGARD